MLNSIASYCARCGQKMESAVIGGKTRPVCSKCGFVHYANPVPGVGVVIEMEDGVVLVRRGHQPAKGRWALPSGFVEAGESTEEAAIRECEEETGLIVEIVELFGVDSFSHGELQNTIIVFYRARPVGGKLRPGDDAVDTAVYAPEKLPHNLAFRTHQEILTRWAGLKGITPSFATNRGIVIPLTPDVIIRKAQGKDEQEIIEMLPLIPANEKISEDDLVAAGIRFRERGSLEVLVAEDSGEIVGFLVLSFVSALTGLRAWIDDVAVKEEHRRRGIGQALVEAAIQQASMRGATYLYLDTSRGNPDAKDFYHACGFKEGGVAPLHIR